MTCFEHFFAAIKKVLNKDDLYEIWPDFCPHYDEYEYAWTSIRGLDETLLLNCGPCEGPSDLRHAKCKSCVEKRESMAKGAFQKATGQQKDNWRTIILCRIHQR